MAKQVSKTYGNALFEVALENQTLDSTLEEVLFVKQVFLENEDLNKLLSEEKIDEAYLSYNLGYAYMGQEDSDVCFIRALNN